MQRRDPFLQRRDDARRTGMPFKSSSQYLTDLLLYANRPINPPPRNDASFERALQFRQREKAKIDALAAENERLQEVERQYAAIMARANELKQSRLNSKEIAIPDVVELAAADSGGSGARGSRRVRIDAPAEQPAGERGDEQAGEVRRAVLRDPRGSAGEHADAGRPDAGDGGSERPAEVGVSSDEADVPS